MQYSKTHCPECPIYTKCPQSIKLYVNYCGQRRKILKSKIDKAFSQCRFNKKDAVKTRLPEHIKHYSHV